MGADDLATLEVRTAAALARDLRPGELGAHVPPGEIDEVRILSAWLSSHPDTPWLPLRPAPGRDALAAFVSSALERQRHDGRADLVGADGHG